MTDSMTLARRYASSLQVNPSRADIGLSPQGSNYAWALFGIFALAALLLAFVAHSRPKGRRAFHYLGMAVLITTSIAYASLAADLSYTPVPVEFVRSGTRGADQLAAGAPFPLTRSIFYGRYIDWAIVSPLLVLILLLTTAFTLSRIFIVVYSQALMIVCGLIGALIPTLYKFAFFTFGCAILFYILWTLLMPARVSAYRIGHDVGRAYTSHAIALSFLFSLYPIVWGLCEGGNVLRVTSEFIWYGILDMLVKIFWLFSFLLAIENIDYTVFGFRSGKVTDVYDDQAAGGGRLGDGGPMAKGPLGERGGATSSTTTAAQPGTGATAATSRDTANTTSATGGGGGGGGASPMAPFPADTRKIE